MSQDAKVRKALDDHRDLVLQRQIAYDLRTATLNKELLKAGDPQTKQKIQSLIAKHNDDGRPLVVTLQTFETDTDICPDLLEGLRGVLLAICNSPNWVLSKDVGGEERQLALENFGRLSLLTLLFACTERVAFWPDHAPRNFFDKVTKQVFMPGIKAILLTASSKLEEDDYIISELTKAAKQKDDRLETQSQEIEELKAREAQNYKMNKRNTEEKKESEKRIEDLELEVSFQNRKIDELERCVKRNQTLQKCSSILWINVSLAPVCTCQGMFGENISLSMQALQRKNQSVHRKPRVLWLLPNRPPRPHSRHTSSCGQVKGDNATVTVYNHNYFETPQKQGKRAAVKHM